MREIKFRGKRVDTGTFVYGSIVNNLWKKSELTPTPGKIVCEMITSGEYDESERAYADCWDDMDSAGRIVEVTPETVGQFTGIKDKSNTEVYEGDIVSILDLTSRREPFIAEVYFCLNTASFSGKVKGYPIDLFLHNPIKKDDWIPEMQPYITERVIEVIGNIHDNPELLNY